ncbi:MAG: SDR family oxidoreductase [Abitibacteriaceae bacterium]|nr:SDR family oxidoreductase [Abditibacteriaceae bacterium]MBV9867370.1 SDR family oxidoreductase [Abditibacteriaceae bacterium]
MNTSQDKAGRLAGKIAIVTGATSGVGSGIALEFALEGAKVLLTGRDQERADKILQEIEAQGVPREHLSFHPADLASVEQCQSIVPQAIKVFGALDVLVNNAGDVTRGNIENTSVELWDRHMAVNLRAPFILTQAAYPHMKERGGGSIINIGSVNAYSGETKLMSYSASKGGLMTFTRNVASYLHRYRIRVNQLNVGWTLTEGEDKVMRADTGRDDWLEEAIKTRPFGRLLSPRDIALAALYFASDDSALINGSVLDMEQTPVGSRA